MIKEGPMSLSIPNLFTLISFGCWAKATQLVLVSNSKMAATDNFLLNVYFNG